MTAGELFIVGTPIGNLADMVPRALSVLQSVDCIAAEDTRRTAQLLKNWNIRTPLIAYHDHNEGARAEQLLVRLQQGESIALVSDAGTPAISDPGFNLVRLARAASLQVTPIPGPCAAILALSGAGLPTDQFHFSGFPPAKGKARSDWFSEILQAAYTQVLYESPHRIENLLTLIRDIDPERNLVLARELTKRYETWLSGTAENLLAEIARDPQQKKGEFVVLIEPRPQRGVVSDEEVRRVMAILIQDLPPNKAAKHAAKILNVSKRECYQVGLALKGA